MAEKILNLKIVVSNDLKDVYDTKLSGGGYKNNEIMVSENDILKIKLDIKDEQGKELKLEDINHLIRVGSNVKNIKRLFDRVYKIDEFFEKDGKYYLYKIKENMDTQCLMFSVYNLDSEIDEDVLMDIFIYNDSFHKSVLGVVNRYIENKKDEDIVKKFVSDIRSDFDEKEIEYTIENIDDLLFSSNVFDLLNYVHENSHTDEVIDCFSSEIQKSLSESVNAESRDEDYTFAEGINNIFGIAGFSLTNGKVFKFNYLSV
ncbi:hypothetical protein [Staphylococcus phage S6]|nr:hypothetical protein [Staphylococcus phage S6]